MIALGFDAARLITVMIHTGAAPTEAEMTRVVAHIDAVAASVGKSQGASSTTIVIVETDHGPNAAQRKRIGAAAKRISRSYQVLVTRSSVVRAIMTAIRWLSPSDENNHQASYATYEEARAWLVARAGLAGDMIDAVHADAREQLRAGAGAAA
jgi:hypothetical protein